MFEPVRGGTRGGQAEFKWSDVSADKDRENYLGHSINAPTGRWQKNKDVHWYNRDQKDDAAERAEEIRKVKEAEADALATALGFAPAPKTIDGAPVSGSNAIATIPKEQTAESAEASRALEKEEKRRKKAERKEERKAKKEAKRALRGIDDVDRPRHRDRSRSRSPRRRRSREPEPVPSHMRRLRSRSRTPPSRDRHSYPQRAPTSDDYDRDRERARRREDAGSRDHPYHSSSSRPRRD